MALQVLSTSIAIFFSLNMIANDELSREGEKQIEAVLQNWLRTALPYLPEEGIQVISVFLERFLEVINKRFSLFCFFPTTVKDTDVRKRNRFLVSKAINFQNVMKLRFLIFISF